MKPPRDDDDLYGAGCEDAQSAAAEIERLKSLNAELLAALKQAEEWLDGWASAEPYISEIRAAIKKAEA